MRRIGSLAGEQVARRFQDYLTTQSIDVALEPMAPQSTAVGHAEGAEFEVWVREEKHVEQAKAILAQYRSQPDDAKYNVSSEAERIRNQRVAEAIEKRKLQRQMPATSTSMGMFGAFPAKQQKIPLTLAIIGISILASFITRFGRPMPSETRGEYSFEELVFCNATFVDPRLANPRTRDFDDPFASIKNGEVWRLVTPVFLHADTFHLLFNMLWVYTLGGLIERLHGSLFFGVLVIVTQVVGMIVQVFFPEALGGSPFAIGASGAVYGLFGYLWIRPVVDPSFPVRLAPVNVALMLGWLVLCFTPAIGNVANGAHLGGLLAGVAAAPLVVASGR